MSAIDEIINSPNSPFSDGDVEQLKQMSPELLQRIALLSSQSQTQESDGESAESSLKAELKTCQEDILNLLASEREIRKELETYGISASSIIEKIVPPQTKVQGGTSMSEDDVMEFIHSSNSITAQMLREGMDARRQGRSKAVQTILQATGNETFTQEELEKMPTPELLKWASVLRTKRSAQFDTPVYNWEGTAMADRSVGHSSSGYLGAPLDVLPTSPKK